MRYFALCLVGTAFFNGCDRAQSQPAENSNKIVQASKIRLAGLTEEQKRKLDQRIPPEIREALNNAEEFTILYNVDKKTMQLEVLMSETVPNAAANVADPALKKEFLDSFYSDASINSNGMSCFSPRHRIKAKYKKKVIEMDICYDCANFRGTSSSGDFGGSVDSQGKSAAVIDAIIQKYGTKLK